PADGAVAAGPGPAPAAGQHPRPARIPAIANPAGVTQAAAAGFAHYRAS
nr:hypothetical protein [Tanacetum cinerariifolium]